MRKHYREGPPPKWTGIPAILIALVFMGYFLVKAGRPILEQGYWWFLALWCLVPILVIYGGIKTLLGKNKGAQRKKDGTIVYKSPGFDLGSTIMGGAFLIIGFKWMLESILAGNNGWIAALLWMLLAGGFFFRGLKGLLNGRKK